MVVLHTLVTNIKEATTNRTQALKAYEKAYNDNDKDIDIIEVELHRWDTIYWDSLNKLFDFHGIDQKVLECASEYQARYGSWI